MGCLYELVGLYKHELNDKIKPVSSRSLKIHKLLNKETLLKVELRSCTWGRILGLGFVIQVIIDMKTCLD